MHTQTHKICESWIFYYAGCFQFLSLCIYKYNVYMYMYVIMHPNYNTKSRVRKRKELYHSVPRIRPPSHFQPKFLHRYFCPANKPPPPVLLWLWSLVRCMLKPLKIIAICQIKAYFVVFLQFYPPNGQQKYRDRVSTWRSLVGNGRHPGISRSRT